MTYMNAYFPWLPFLGHVLEISEKQDQAGQPRLSVQSWAKEALLIRNPAATVTVAIETGFYLGYLRGRSFPPQKNIVISTVNYIGKIIQTRRGQCTHRSISQNCLKMHQIASQRTFISKTFRGGILTLGTDKGVRRERQKDALELNGTRLADAWTKAIRQCKQIIVRPGETESTMLSLSKDTSRSSAEQNAEQSWSFGIHHNQDLCLTQQLWQGLVSGIGLVTH